MTPGPTPSDPTETDREPEQWLQDWADLMARFGADATSYEYRLGEATFEVSFPDAEIVRVTFTGAEPERFVPAVTRRVQTLLHKGEIKVEHDWGIALLYRLADVDLRRMDVIAAHPERSLGTPIVLGQSKVVDVGDVRCMRCEERRIARDVARDWCWSGSRNEPR